VVTPSNAGFDANGGLPVADFSYTQCENDRQVIQAARGVMENILRAAGATEVITIERYVHLVGDCPGGRRRQRRRRRRESPDVRIC
jgi:hypothetical protein